MPVAQAIALEELAAQALAAREGVSFEEFFRTIFPLGYEAVEGVWGPGGHLFEWCRRLEENRRTCTIAPRNALKSTVFRALVAWYAWRLPELKHNVEVFYMSFTANMAAYHTGKIGLYIAQNPLYQYRGVTSTGKATTVLRYRSADSRRTLTCIPIGVFGFKRGIHSDIFLGDDLLQTDAKNKRLDIFQIAKVTEIFQKEVVKIPKIGHGQLHVAGTPQDSNDLLFRMRGMPSVDWAIYPAVDNEGRLLWPDVLTAKRLQEDRRTMGAVAYAAEMLCQPQRSAASFLSRDLLLAVRQKKGDPLATIGEVVGGFDIGKKRHPSHLSLLRIDPKTKDLRQILSVWMEGWAYSKQIEYLRKIAVDYEVRFLAYDNTNREFEGFAERRELPRSWIPVALTSASTGKLAADLDVEVTNGRLRLLDETDESGYDRQLEQLLAVDGNLDAMETAMGHGDSFWSNALAVFASKAALRPRGFVDRYLREEFE